MPVVVIINVLDNHSAYHSGKKGRKVVLVYNPYNRQKNDAHNPVMEMYFPFAPFKKNRVYFAVMDKKMAKNLGKDIADYNSPGKGKRIVKGCG